MLTVTVADCTNAPCHENHVTSSFTRSYCRQYVPGTGGACTVALRLDTVPPGATSLASSVRSPQIATGLPAAHAPLCQWYANRTGFVPPAFHVADPAFVNDTGAVVDAPGAIVAGSVLAPHVTLYCGAIACAAFTRPQPVLLSKPATSMSVAVEDNRLRIWFLSVTPAEISRPATPATCGAANDVPLPVA